VPVLPRADVGVIAFAAGLVVRAVAEHVDFAVHARIQILILRAPRIGRQAFQIAAVLPVVRHRLGRRLLDQRLKTLLLRGITAVIQSIQLHRLHDGADVLLGRDAARFVRTAHDLRHDQRGENAENRDHDHDFDQRETALKTAAVLRWRCL
jgi:hypothetical protein